MHPMLAAELAERRALVDRESVLARLCARLTRLLGPLATDAPYLPDAKALLSRDGGVCPADGSRLRFDPDSPHEHRCGRCGRVVSGPRHHRAWIMRYQVWLSERAVHLALLGALRDPALSARAAGILVAYARRYETYPNEDNVLGPSRLFFSTYLESIWLTQLSVAFAILDASGGARLEGNDRTAVARMLLASADLVASFNEGWSNRQVWNSTALLAAGAALGDGSLVSAGTGGLRGLLRAVDNDGMWHEGENYHLFSLRGFLLGAECARLAGEDLYAGTALRAMYAAPLATLLPDLTLPARGDAPFGVSVVQPRFAELWEVGRTRTGDARLDAILAALYAADLPEGDDHGRVDLAEQDENRPPARVRRDGLGWKALLWMRPDDPVRGPVVPAAAVLRERQGVAVLRPAPDTLVALECGARAVGHGHPDALHLTVARGCLLLGDCGAASYVSPSLHWYRSTLAHNAPGIAGRGQAPVAGVCDGVGAAGGWSWCRVYADGLLGPGTWARRTIVAGPRWVLDVVAVNVPPEVVVDLPVHPFAGLVLPGEPASATTLGSTSDAGHETGYAHVTEVTVVPVPEVIPLDATGGVMLHTVARPTETAFVATAPGPPGPDYADGAPLAFLLRRARGAGRWVHVLTWHPGAVEITEHEERIDVRCDGRTVSVAVTPTGLVVRTEGEAPVTFDARPAPRPGPAPPPPPAVPDCEVPLWPDDAEPFSEGLRVAEWELGEGSYRRSEAGHADRGATCAEVAVAAQGDALFVRVRVTKPVVVVRAADAADPALDNEPADIHSDGVQAYLARDQWMGVLAVPDLASRSVRIRGVGGTAPFQGAVTGSSRRTPDGYELRLRLATGRPWRAGERLRFTVTVNEMVPGRERRSGQLALAGGGWVWLRGDRESPAEAVEAEIA
jgi:hypothetical protein